MPQFSRRTILAATDIVGSWSHAVINRFLLDHALEDSVDNGSCMTRGMNLARYLMNHPDYPDQDGGGNLTDSVISEIIRRALESCQNYDRQFVYNEFQNRYEALHRALERDGFTVEDGTLRRTLPQAFDLPAADNEVHVLLDRYNFATSRGHLDQAIAAHARGDWAAANAQFRSFIESLFDSIAEHLNAGAPGLPAAGHQRRQWLANRNPPFFSAALNEWTGQGTGFIEGFFRRLHPAGAHPGLSDEEDSTFRLHMVLLVARTLLRRI
jgi:hypothetical protein